MSKARATVTRRLSEVRQTLPSSETKMKVLEICGTFEPPLTDTAHKRTPNCRPGNFSILKNSTFLTSRKRTPLVRTPFSRSTALKSTRDFQMRLLRNNFAVITFLYVNNFTCTGTHGVFVVFNFSVSGWLCLVRKGARLLDV